MVMWLIVFNVLVSDGNVYYFDEILFVVKLYLG